MWLSRQGQGQGKTETAAEFGSVSVAGQDTAVYGSGERRQVPICAPGGVFWAPRVGQEVILLSCGVEQQPFIVGNAQEPGLSKKLAPGELFLSVNGAESGVHLAADGTVHLLGEVYLNGELLVIQKPEPEPPVGGGT